MYDHKEQKNKKQNKKANTLLYFLLLTAQLDILYYLPT